MNIAMLGPTDTVHFRRLVESIVERGHNVHVVSMKPQAIRGATFERFSVPPFGWRYPYRWRNRWEAKMRRLFRDFDVVNVHFLADWGITESVAREGHLVVKAYGSDVDHPPDTPLPDASLLAARKQLLRCADRVVSPSCTFRRLVAEYAGIDEFAIETLPFGVDVQQFKPRRTTRDNALTIGYFKGFEPVYGPMTMVRAAAFVLERCPGVRFEFVGDGTLRDACRALAEELGIARAIRWHDYQPHEALPAILSRWDIAAITSVKESFCVAAIEAAAMELPVVATDVGGLSESVADGETGILVPPGDADAVGAALVTLVDDPVQRRTMGEAGRARVADCFDWNECVDRWIGLFNDVRAGRSVECLAI